MKPHLLLVEDDDSIRRSLELFLAHNFEVVPCASLAQAVAYIAAAIEIDLVVTDFMLDNGDGLHVAEAVRMRFPDAHILLITGSAMNHTRIEALLRLPNTTFFSKPFDLHKLEGTLLQLAK